MMQKNENIPNSSLFDSMGSVPSVGFLILLFSLSVVPTLVFGQSTPGASSFYQVVERTYGIKDGLPDICISQVLLDSKGRLHLATCGSNYASSALQVYDFDGIQSYPAGFELAHEANKIVFEEDIAPDIFYGFYTYPIEHDSVRHAVFQFNALTRTTDCFDMNKGAIVQSVAFTKEALFACVYHSATQQGEIIRIQNGVLSSMFIFNMEAPFSSLRYRARLTVTDSDFWVARSAGHIYRINRKSGTQRQYALPGVRDSQFVVSQFSTTHGRDIWINCEGIHFWDSNIEHFTKNPYLPTGWDSNALTSAWLSKDLHDNMLVWYLNNDEITSATLIDERRQDFDYTPIAMAGSRGLNGDTKKWMSNDYKQGILFFFPGLRFVEYTPYNAVQKMLDFQHNRSMVQFDQQTIYSRRGGELSYKNGAWRPTGRLFFNSEWHGDMEIKKDGKGNIWCPLYSGYSKKGYLARLQPDQARMDSFYMEMGFGRYDFLSDNQIAFEAYNNLYLLNTQTGKTKQLTKESTLNIPNPNQVFVSSDSLIWVACSKGLLRIDPRTGEQEWIKLLNKRVAVMRIHEDAKGRFWLGTIINGVLIYDRSNGTIKTIDKTNGLSNNMVVSLLEDDDGVIWAGTYYGLTLLSQEGVVIGKIFEEDGLAENECNRWSALKLDDGRLCFGSNAGLSFIDPSLLKKRIQEGTPPRIYLTKLSNKVPGESLISTDLLPRFEQNERIVLPAENRNLKINFALSNYIAPEKSTFAYLIEGRGEGWNYIGNQRQLALNALPAGKYNILIKGADGWGRWSAQPIIIPVTVREYFFKTWWAFGLLVLVILTPLYFIRKYQIRQLLEHAENQRLHEIDSLKTKLYNNITHEFRTPLTVISGMADMIEKPVETKELILRNSKRLLHLVNQMLGLAKLDSGKLEVHWQQGDVVVYLKYILEAFRSYATTKNIDLTFYSEIKSMNMDYDPEKLQHVVTNLLSNAVKFTPAHGKIVFQVTNHADKELVIEVKDTGIGMEAEHLSYIFDRFYQIDAMHPHKGEGTGIGLALTKELVELMGGDISVESVTGEGSDFKVVLPIHRLAEAVSDEPFELDDGFRSELANTQVSVIDPTLDDETDEPALPIILLIEDNADVATYLISCLEGQYQVVYAENGQLGIDKALETIPDVIISDVMMPEKDGFEVCQALKNDELTSHIPIILLTAKADVESRLEGLNVGADAYLSKPFLKEELFIRLEKLVELRQVLQGRYANFELPEPQEIPSATATKQVTVPLEDAFLKKVNQTIEDHLDEASFDTGQLCQKMGLSQSQLFRKVKALTNKSIVIYIRSYRLHRAKELLLSSNQTISEIAYEVGFTDPSYFTRAFSKEFGVPPSETRK